MTGAIQEALLCLLCFSKEEGDIVRSLVPQEVWEAYYDEIAKRATAYWQSYQEPPGEHLLDIVDSICVERKKDEAVFRRLYKSMCEIKDGINAKYIIDEATTFIRQQRLKVGILEAVDHLQSGNLDQAEQVLVSSMRGVLNLFDPGVRFQDTSRLLSFLSSDVSAFSTGIDQLDSRQLGPSRKELHLFVAPPKRGKTWWLIHLGKQALLQHLIVVHITLEMSEKKISQRYIQSLFSVSKRKEPQQRIAFTEDELGRFVGIETLEVQGRPSFQDPDIEQKLRNRLDSIGSRIKLIIKEFPTGALTVRELEGYLDALQLSAKIIPDLLLIDYADLMHVDTQYFRQSLGKLYQDLRGIAVKRNIAVATASQSNREGASSKLLTGTSVAEDFSKIATADVILTYNQTTAEQELKLARLFVANGRNDEDRFEVLVAQNYGLGQFCLDSTRMISKYWSVLRDLKAGGDELPE